MLVRHRISRPLAIAAASALVALVGDTTLAAAQSISNDKYDQATAITMGTTATSPDSNVFARIDPGEPLTDQAPNDNKRCDTHGKASADTGAQLFNSAWWTFTGTGGTVTVSTESSSPAFDSVLAVYDAAKNPFTDVTAFLACNDDIGAKGGDAAPTLSKLAIPTVSGHPYAVQVGSCQSTTTSPQSCAATYSQIAVTVTSTAAPIQDPGPGGGTTIPPTPTGPPALAKFKPKFSDIGFKRVPERKRTRLTHYSVTGVPAGTAITITCSPTRRCPFRGTLRGTVGKRPYSLVKLLARRGATTPRWGTTLTITLRKSGYADKVLKVSVSLRNKGSVSQKYA